MSHPFADNPVSLSEAGQAALQAWVDAARARLALSDWEITVVREQSEGTALASSFVRHEADVSHIALSAEIAEWSPDELRQTLTHELLHCHFERVTALANRLVEHELGRRTEAVITSAVSLIEEQTIDRLATAIARFLPLPEMPAGLTEPKEKA